MLLHIGLEIVAEVGGLLEGLLHLQAYVVEPHDLGLVHAGPSQVHGETAHDREGEDVTRGVEEVGGNGVGGYVDQGPRRKDASELVAGVVDDGLLPKVAAHGYHDPSEILH